MKSTGEVMGVGKTLQKPSGRPLRVLVNLSLSVDEHSSASKIPQRRDSGSW